MQLDQIPVVKAEMLIRRPVADVFEAFTDPQITTKFWLTKGSGRLEHGIMLNLVADHFPAGLDLT